MDDLEAGDGKHPVVRPRSRLFAVRLWKEAVAGGSEYRGSVREVVGGAFRSFRDWPELVAFMTARMDEVEGVQEQQMEGET